MSSTIASSTTSSEPQRGIGLRHGEPERLAAPAEMEAALLLDDHREIGGKPVHRPDVDELTAQRPHREVGNELRRGGAGRDHEHVVWQLAGVGAFADLHPTLGCAPDELARDL